MTDRCLIWMTVTPLAGSHQCDAMAQAGHVADSLHIVVEFQSNGRTFRCYPGGGCIVTDHNRTVETWRDYGALVLDETRDRSQRDYDLWERRADFYARKDREVATPKSQRIAGVSAGQSPGAMMHFDLENGGRVHIPAGTSDANVERGAGSEDQGRVSAREKP